MLTLMYQNYVLVLYVVLGKMKNKKGHRQTGRLTTENR